MHYSTVNSLLLSGEYSDFTITCQGDTYKVHKAVVCARSGFFKRAERFPTSEVRRFAYSVNVIPGLTDTNIIGEEGYSRPTRG